MARVYENDPHRPATGAAVSSLRGARTRDISALAWALLLLGLAALGGALVRPVSPPLLAPTAGALALVGLGLLRRAPWSRTAAISLFAVLILGQLSRRWLESDLFQPFLASMRGVHEASLSQGPLTLMPTSAVTTLGLAGAVCGAMLCLAMGFFVVRLASRAARSEFESPTVVRGQPATRRGSPTSPSQ